MFGFKKNNAVQRDTVLYNFDKQPVINTQTGEFLMDFDSRQQHVLRELLDKQIPIGSFAYKGLPANNMLAIKDWIYTITNVYPDGTLCITYPEHFNENVIYNIVHTDFDAEQTKYALIASQYGVDVCKEIQGVSNFSPTVLALVAEAARYGKNFCDKVYQGMNPFQLAKEVDRVREDFLRKQEKKDKRDDLFYKFFT